MRVLLLHNRYRQAGGEERAVELQAAAFERAGIEHRVLERESGEASRSRAARAMLRGGERPEDVAQAVRDFGADIVHVHNLHPLFGHRSLAAARDAGAAVVVHLHNYRLFCSIAIAFRDGEQCFRCRGRRTLPGFVLNCRGSLPESAVYTTALALHQPALLEAVDRFITPSHFAAGQLERLGLPRERVDVVASYVPEAPPAAHDGGYALVAGRLSVEKGVATAIEAAAISGVPLEVAGDGPLADDLRARARGAPVEFLGRVPRERLDDLLANAAMALVPSVSADVMPYAALEAIAAGVPVIGSDAGSLPEVLGEERCVPRRDARALAAAMRRLLEDPAEREAEGRRLRERAREQFGEERYLRELLATYDAAQAGLRGSITAST
ncbi:MAG: glycosyltransferase family 4 protein [Thermoleophilaceae bacterium]